jgi:hypothetical protein
LDKIIRIPVEGGVLSPPKFLVEQPTTEKVTRMKLVNLKTEAQDLYLCENGQILFKVDE